MLTAFTFPGQGAQRPGMLRNLPTGATSQTRQAEAEAVLGQPLETLDSPDALSETRNVQLALLISGVIWGEHLRERGCRPDFVLGLSIGAYPAAVVAGSLSFDDALRLVDLRGKLMHEAYPRGFGMMAVTGARQTLVEATVAECQAQGVPVYLANLNGEQQFVLAGPRDRLEATAASIRAEGQCASQMLDVAVPSHCELLAPQARQLQTAISEVQIRSPRAGYVSAAKARVLHGPEAIRQDLALNMAHQVHWHDSCQMLTERGIQHVVEMPPGSTLTGLFRRLLPRGLCQAAATTTLQALLDVQQAR